MEPYFKDKTVLVTGAGWGIGAAIALLYATNGAKVIVSDTSRKGGRETVAKIKRQKGDATYIGTDVNNAAACERLINSTIETYGSIDIACNNSAIFGVPMSLDRKDIEAFDMEVSLSITGLNNCVHSELNAMQRQGGGIILNTSCVVNAIGLASLNQYLIAKYGMTSLARNTPGKYPAAVIHINAISPAFINTAIWKAGIQKKKDERIKLSPGDRLGMPKEVAGLILWLSSGETHLLPTVAAVHDN